MAHLSNDKSVAKSTVFTASIRAFLSTQFKTLSDGKSLRNSMDAVSAAYIQTVQTLIENDATHKERFYLFLSQLLQDERFPIFTELSDLSNLLVFLRKFSAIKQPELSPLVALTKKLVSNKYSSGYLNLTEGLSYFHPRTPYEWSIFLNVYSEYYTHADAHTCALRFWNSYLEKYNYELELSSLRYLTPRQYLVFKKAIEISRHLSKSGLKALIALVDNYYPDSFCTNLLGKILGWFFADVFPIAHKMVDTYPTKDLFEFWVSYNQFDILSDCQEKVYTPQKSTNKPFKIKFEEIDDWIELSPYLPKDFQPKPFIRVLQYLPKIVLANFGQVPNALLVHLLEGKNIRSYHSTTFLTKKEAHIFHQLEETECEFDECLLYSFVKALGGSATFFEQIRPYFSNRFPHHYRHVEITILYSRLRAIFQKIIEWEVTTRLEEEEFTLLMNYLSHVLRDVREYSISGRTLNSVIRAASVYQQNNLDNKNIRSLTWKGANYTPFKEVIAGITYRIIQYTCSKDLRKESRQLSHCVRSYDTKCFREGTSIWSLQKEKNGVFRSLITIEIRSDKKIVQTKGAHNRLPSNAELEIIQHWARREKLTL